MTGLEKITSRILEDAKADARNILDDATEKSLAIRAHNQQVAKEACDRILADAEKEGENLIVRAKSSAAMTRRNIDLAAKSEMIEFVFSRAMQEIYEMEREKYAALVLSLLCKTLNAQRESEQDSIRLYGEDIAPARYEMMLNARDHADVAELLMIGIKNAAAAGKVPADMAKKLVLLPAPVEIDGGLVLRCGDVETNCSFSMILAGIRPELEPRVQQILYKDQKKS